MQDFVYSHAPVESAKAINLHDLSSDWINLKEKNIRNRTCSIYSYATDKYWDCLEIWNPG